MDPILGNAKKTSNGERDGLWAVISALPPTEEGEGTADWLQSCINQMGQIMKYKIMMPL